mgnify:FL=1
MLIPTGASASASAVFDTTLIGNSIQLDGSADFLSRTNFTLSADGKKEFIFSMWIQRNEFGRAQTHFDLVPTGHSSYNDGTHFWFAADDQLGFSVANGGSSGGGKETSAVYRDISWYHVLISYNTNASITAASRHRLFVNGLEISDTSTYTAPSDNQSCLGSGTGNADLRIGRTDHSGIPYPPKSYFAQACYLEGKSFQAGDYAITDFLDSFAFGSNGSQFGPKANADIAALASTVGGNSFCLDFADSGGTDAANLGNDISDNNNDLTPTSMAAANQSSNTPSLVYPLLNPLSAAFSTTLSNGNTTASGTTGNGDDINPGIIIPKTGKWVWQITNTTDADLIYGVRNFVDMKAGDYAYTNLFGFYSHTGNLVQGASPSGSYLDAASGGDVYQIYYNADTRKMWVSDNGTIPNSGNPDGGSNEMFTIPDSGFDLCPTALVGGTAPNSTFDFGLSGVSLHANGQDFKPLTSANVEPQTIQGVDGFATTLATESNIVSSVATSRDGWGTAYVDILKNRSSIETWLYRFGDDSSNEFTAPVGSYPSYSSTYQSTSSLSGTDNWLGYSIRIGADYLTAAGSASHSNGSATTITHNLGTSRYCVLLFERGSSKDVWFHHPDFASGSLLKFVKDEALASSTQITTIGANSFEIGSGAATATYSYLVFADGGIAAMGKHVGNGVVNGPYIAMAHSSGFFARRSGGARNFWNNNSKSPGYNENGNYARFNDTQAEGTGSLKIDMLAGAVKIRDAYADQNTSGETYYWFSFGELSGGGTSLPPVYGR